MILVPVRTEPCTTTPTSEVTKVTESYIPILYNEICTYRLAVCSLPKPILCPKCLFELKRKLRRSLTSLGHNISLHCLLGLLLPNILQTHLHSCLSPLKTVFHAESYSRSPTGYGSQAKQQGYALPSGYACKCIHGSIQNVSLSINNSFSLGVIFLIFSFSGSLAPYSYATVPFSYYWESLFKVFDSPFVILVKIIFKVFVQLLMNSVFLI